MLRKILFWSGFPFVLPQAFWVKKNATRFEGASGPNEGAFGKGSSYQLIALGDSIIAGVGANTLEQALVGQTAKHLAQKLDIKVHWQAFGKIGAETREIIEELLPVISADTADFVLISTGVNDITTMTMLSNWRLRLRNLIELLKFRYPHALIAVAGIPPLKDFPLLPQPLKGVFGIRGDFFDETARELVSTIPSAVYLPFKTKLGPENFSLDGYHPSELGYDLFGEMAATNLAELFNQKIRVSS